MDVAILFALGAAFLFSGVSVTMALADNLSDPDVDHGAAGELADVRVG